VKERLFCVMKDGISFLSEQEVPPLHCTLIMRSPYTEGMCDFRCFLLLSLALFMCLPNWYDAHYFRIGAYSIFRTGKKSNTGMSLSCPNSPGNE